MLYIRRDRQNDRQYLNHHRLIKVTESASTLTVEWLECAKSRYNPHNPFPLTLDARGYYFSHSRESRERTATKPLQHQWSAKRRGKKITLSHLPRNSFLLSYQINLLNQFLSTSFPGFASVCCIVDISDIRSLSLRSFQLAGYGDPLNCTKTAKWPGRWVKISRSPIDDFPLDLKPALFFLE